MPTLLRFLIGLIAFVYLQAAIAGSALIVVTTRSGNAWALAGAGVGTALLGMVPMAAGIMASYTRWSDDVSKRHLRRWLAVGVGLQALGAVLAILGAVGSAGVLVVGVEILVAVGLDFALVGMGRAARRRDRLPDSGDEWIDTTAADIRKGWRNAAIGFLIGLAVAVVVLVIGVALSSRSDHGFDGQFAFEGLSFAVLGAAIGLMINAFRVARRMREATGSDYGTMRRIGRVVLRGKSEPLNADEEQRAARYATIASRWLPYQGAQYGLLYTGIVLTQVGALFGRHDEFGVVQITEIGLLIVVYAVLLPLLLRRARRASAYASAHATPARAGGVA